MAKIGSLSARAKVSIKFTLEGTCGVLDHSYSVDILTCVQLFSDLQRCFLMITDVLEFSLLDVLYILSNCSLDVF